MKAQLQNHSISSYEHCPMFHWALVHLQQSSHLTLVGFH